MNSMIAALEDIMEEWGKGWWQFLDYSRMEDDNHLCCICENLCISSRFPLPIEAPHVLPRADLLLIVIRTVKTPIKKSVKCVQLSANRFGENLW